MTLTYRSDLIKKQKYSEKTIKLKNVPGRGILSDIKLSQGQQMCNTY